MLGSINMSYKEIKGGFIDRWFLNGKMILWQQLGDKLPFDNGQHVRVLVIKEEE